MSNSTVYILKNPENPFRNNCFPQSKDSCTQRFSGSRSNVSSENSSQHGLTHGCSPTSQWVQHGSVVPAVPAAVCADTWWATGWMAGMAVRRFSLSFPLVSHLLWYLVVTSCGLTCRYDTLCGVFGGERGKRDHLYLNNCSTSSKQEGHKNS